MLDTRGLDELGTHEVLPEGVLELDEWAYVITRENIRDLSRRSMYVLANAPGLLPGEVAEASVRLQGYVEECNISPLGDWNLCVVTPIKHSDVLIRYIESYRMPSKQNNRSRW